MFPSLTRNPSWSLSVAMKTSSSPPITESAAPTVTEFLNFKSLKRLKLNSVQAATLV